MFSGRNKKTIFLVDPGVLSLAVFGICHRLLQDHLTHCSLETPKRVTGKSADQDQMPQNAASDQGLHCLQTVQPFFSMNV